MLRNKVQNTVRDVIVRHPDRAVFSDAKVASKHRKIHVLKIMRIGDCVDRKRGITHAGNHRATDSPLLPRFQSSEMRIGLRKRRDMHRLSTDELQYFCEPCFRIFERLPRAGRLDIGQRSRLRFCRTNFREDRFAG